MKKIIFSVAVLTTALATAQNTGIGTTAPTQKLDVNGAIRSRGNIMQDGYDFIVGQGNQVDRGNSGGSRAIVKGNIVDAQGNPISQLIVNYGKDFPAGVSLRGAINVPDILQGSASNSVVVMDENFNLFRVPANSWAAANAVNIYNTNGTLLTDRILDQNNHVLTFTNGNINLAKSLLTNGNLELSNQDTGDRTSFIDFHSADGVDYSTRLYRGAGLNEDFVVRNSGTGRILLGNKTYVQGNLGVSGMDFVLGDGDQSVRGNSGSSRALVKNGDNTSGSQLVINFQNDFTAGTRVDSKLYITNTSGVADATNDKVLTLGNNGEVKNSGSTLSQIASASEPWQVANSTTPATANTQNIYQSGSVGIGTNNPGAQLHVVSAGNITAQMASTSPESVLRILPSNAMDNRLAIITNGDRQDTQFKGFANSISADMLTMKHSSGNIGINTQDPSQKLDVNGNARVRQMPATNDEATYSRVVVADTNGNLATVSRTDPGVPNATETIFKNQEVKTDIIPNDTFASIEQNNADRGAAYWRYTGMSITLPPGKWILYHTYLVTPSLTLPNGTSVWFRATISNDNVNGSQQNGAFVSGGPGLISCSLLADSRYQTASGVWMVDNNSGADKTYYVKVSIEPHGFTAPNDRDLSPMSQWAEDYLFAIKRK